MKRVLSMFLAVAVVLVLLPSLLVPSVQAANYDSWNNYRIGRSGSRYQDLNVYLGGVLLYDLIEQVPGTDQYVYLTWEDVQRENIELRYKIDDNDTASIVKSVELVPYRNGRGDQYARVEIRFIDPYVSLSETDFSLWLYLVVDGNRMDHTAVEVSGTFQNHEQRISAGTRFIDQLFDWPMCLFEGDCPAIKMHLGMDAFLTGSYRAGDRVYGYATSTNAGDYEEDEDFHYPVSYDHAFADKYPSIQEVLNLITINMSQGGNFVEIDRGALYYVYNADQEWIGTTDDKLPYSAIYYLSTERIDETGDNGSGNGNGGDNGSGNGSGGGNSGSTGSSGRGGSSGGGRSTADGDRATAAATSTVARSSNVSSNGVVSQSQIVSEVTQAAASGNVAISARNAVSISPATLRAMAAAAGDKSVALYADTLTEDGRSIQGRLYVEPSKLAGLSSDLLLGIKTDSKSIQAVKRLFETHFNNSIAVIHCEQQGSFGAPLQIAAKVDLSKLDTSSLVFYSYDRAGNTFTRIANPNYSIDSNGYLHFYTQQAGDIIITDRPLSK